MRLPLDTLKALRFHNYHIHTQGDIRTSMKIGTIASTLVTLSLGASLTACGGAELSDGSQLPGDETASGDVMSDFEPEYVQIGEEITACDDQQYDHWRNLAALAVASANELGRWNSAKDFVKTNVNGQPAIALSNEGLARCTNNCDNIKAILSSRTTLPRSFRATTLLCSVNTW